MCFGEKLSWFALLDSVICISAGSFSRLSNNFPPSCFVCDCANFGKTFSMNGNDFDTSQHELTASIFLFLAG